MKRICLTPREVDYLSLHREVLELLAQFHDALYRFDVSRGTGAPHMHFERAKQLRKSALLPPPYEPG